MEYNEKTFSLMQDSRMINLSESLLFPLLDKMIEDQTNTMVSRFNGGEKDLLTCIASIATLMDLRNNLKATQIRGNKEAAKLSESGNRN